MRVYVLIFALVFYVPPHVARWHDTWNHLNSSVFYSGARWSTGWVQIYEAVVGVGAGLWLYWYTFLSKSDQVTSHDRRMVGFILGFVAFALILHLLQNYLVGLGYLPLPHGT